MLPGLELESEDRVRIKIICNVITAKEVYNRTKTYALRCSIGSTNCGSGMNVKKVVTESSYLY